MHHGAVVEGTLVHQSMQEAPRTIGLKLAVGAPKLDVKAAEPKADAGRG
jgi:hypothetical protein